MSEENVQVVRDVMALREWVRESGERPPHSELIAPDAEIDLSRRVFNPATYHGIDGWMRLNDEIREVWEDFHVVPAEFIDAGHRVVVIETVHARGRGSGVLLDTRRSATIWTLRDEKVTRVQIGFDPQEALKAVGLAG